MRLALMMFYGWTKGRRKTKFEKRYIMDWLKELGKIIDSKDSPHLVKPILELFQDIQMSYYRDLERVLAERKKSQLLVNPFETLTWEQTTIADLFEELKEKFLRELEPLFRTDPNPDLAEEPTHLVVWLTFVCMYGQQQKSGLTKRFLEHVVLQNPKNSNEQDRLRLRTDHFLKRGALVREEVTTTSLSSQMVQFYDQQTDRVIYQITNIPTIFSVFSLLLCLWIIYTEDRIEKVREYPGQVKQTILRKLEPLWVRSERQQKPKRITQEVLRAKGLQVHWQLLDWQLPSEVGQEKRPAVPETLSLKKHLPTAIDHNQQSPEKWGKYWRQTWKGLELTEKGQQWVAERLEVLFTGTRGLKSYSLADTLVAVPPLESLIKVYWKHLRHPDYRRVGIFAPSGMGKSRVILYLASKWRLEHPQGEILVCSEPSQMGKQNWTNFGALLRESRNEIPLLVIMDDLHHQAKATHETLRRLGLTDDSPTTNTWWLGGYTCAVEDRPTEKEYLRRWIKTSEDTLPRWEKEWENWREYFYEWNKWVATVSEQYQRLGEYDWRTMTSPWAASILIGGLREKIQRYFQNRPVEKVIYWVLSGLFLLMEEKPVPFDELMYVLQQEDTMRPFFRRRLGKDWDAHLREVLQGWERPGEKDVRLVPPTPKPSPEYPDVVDFFHQKWAAELWDEWKWEEPKQREQVEEVLTTAYRGLGAVIRLIRELKGGSEILLAPLFRRCRVEEGKLVALNLGSMKIRNFLHEIDELRDLKELNLGNNQLNSLPKTFGNLSKLQILNLSDNKLRSLPKSFGNLVNLTELYLWDNQLTSLPKSFGNLVNLTELYLQHNQLTSLPKSFGNLVNVTGLYLQHNQLMSLPKSFGNLVNLEELFLFGNHLNTLPKTFGNLTTLQILYLHENQLCSLPDSFGNLTALLYLDLSRNQLNSLPESFGSLIKLEYLNLVRNKLSFLPESFGQLVNLQTLVLEDNLLSSLPESFGNLKSLTSLSLRNNKLIHLPKSIGSLSKLKKLDLYNNLLETIPTSFYRLRNLLYLNLKYNSKNINPSSFPKVSQLLKASLHNYGFYSSKRIPLKDRYQYKISCLTTSKEPTSCLISDCTPEFFPYHKRTLGACLYVHQLSLEGGTLFFQVWDINLGDSQMPEEQTRFLRRSGESLIQGSSAIILFFDCTYALSLEDLETLTRFADAYAPLTLKFFVLYFDCTDSTSTIDLEKITPSIEKYVSFFPIFLVTLTLDFSDDTFVDAVYDQINHSPLHIIDHIPLSTKSELEVQNLFHYIARYLYELNLSLVKSWKRSTDSFRKFLRKLNVGYVLDTQD